MLGEFRVGARWEGRWLWAWAWAWARAWCGQARLPPSSCPGGTAVSKAFYWNLPCLLVVQGNQNRLRAASAAGGEERVTLGSFLIPQESAHQKSQTILGSQEPGPLSKLNSVCPSLCQSLVACAWEWTRPWCRSIQQHHPIATSTPFSLVLRKSRRGRKQKPGQNPMRKHVHGGGDPARRSTRLAHPRTQVSFFKKAACGLKDLILIHHHKKPFQVGGKKRGEIIALCFRGFTSGRNCFPIFQVRNQLENP